MRLARSSISIWLKVLVWRSAACFISISLCTTSAGPTTQPTRSDGTEGADIGRRLGQHPVARAEQQPADQVQPLLGAAGDQDIVGTAGDAERGHVSNEPFAQRPPAAAFGVLQGDPRRGRVYQDA